MVDMKHQIPIAAPPDKVYAAIATEAGLRGWWTADTKAEEKVGGKATFGFDNHKFIFHMTIVALSPGKQVVWSCSGEPEEWMGTKLMWTIGVEEGDTVLRFVHGDWKQASDFFASCNSTWGELMYRLKNYVEGRNPGPHWR